MMVCECVYFDRVASHWMRIPVWCLVFWISTSRCDVVKQWNVGCIYILGKVGRVEGLAQEPDSGRHSSARALTIELPSPP